MTPGVELGGCADTSRSNHTGRGGVLELEDGPVVRSTREPSALSPVAILVGAAVSSQVEDEKALGEFICTQQRKGDEVCTPTFQSKATAPLHRSWLPGGCAADASTGRREERREAPQDLFHEPGQGRSYPA